ncbi:hypothetical protein B0T14DRAFT_534278 [Immersiella caudata]|uniref:Nephrocystin 3-like N-terminal domain-containing protein n=1 Tax=Immersiella caudata TaxID=314043 RepID=A0AA39X2G7_9PEZI|nr:hypothetical protein B0T14DRAFT_534278 [Immersiella caudata]
MLVCGIIKELEQAIIASGHCQSLAYFFCQTTDSRLNNATAALRGLIYLLVHRQPRLISHLPTNTCSSNDITYLVIDALDECVIDLPKLLDLVTKIERQLRSGHGLTEYGLGLETNTEHVSRDLDGYLDNKLSSLSSFQHENQLKDRVRDILSQKADDNILWASLVLKELSKDEVESWHKQKPIIFDTKIIPLP